VDKDLINAAREQLIAELEQDGEAFLAGASGTISSISL
jgi:hypothetical protein